MRWCHIHIGIWLHTTLALTPCSTYSKVLINRHLSSVSCDDDCMHTVKVLCDHCQNCAGLVVLNHDQLASAEHVYLGSQLDWLPALQGFLGGIRIKRTLDTTLALTSSPCGF